MKAIVNAILIILIFSIKIFAMEITGQTIQLEDSLYKKIPVLDVQSLLKAWQEQIEHSNASTQKFECHECYKLYNSEYTLRKHQSADHPELRFQCTVENCGRIYHQMSSCRKHNEQCHANKATFTRIKLYKSISQKNPPYEKAYECTQCTKTYNEIRNLIDHQDAVHNGFRFRCTKCDNTFARRSGWFRHNQLQHDKTARYIKIKLAKTVAIEESDNVAREVDDTFRE